MGARCREYKGHSRINCSLSPNFVRHSLQKYSSQHCLCRIHILNNWHSLKTTRLIDFAFESNLSESTSMAFFACKYSTLLSFIN